MKNLARILRTLALTLWLGGILFFGAVLAPTAFRVLPTIHDAGLVVGASLASLHHIGLICAALIAASLIVLDFPRSRNRSLQFALVLIMAAFTWSSMHFITGPMERDRAAANGDIIRLATSDPLRVDFDARHIWSTRIESGVLISGVIIAILFSIEGRNASDPR